METMDNSIKNDVSSISDSELANKKGIEYFQRNLYKEALLYFKRAIELNSDPTIDSTTLKAKYYSNIANCYNKLENFEYAIKAANLSISKDKSWNKGYIQKAIALNNQKNSFDARKLLEEALNFCPGDKAIISTISIVDESISKNTKKQQEELKQLEEINSADPNSLFDLMNKMSKLGICKDINVPKFQDEYLKAYPKADKKDIKELDNHYKLVKSENLREVGIIKQNFISDPNYFAKRFGIIDESIIFSIYEKYQPGEIINEKNDLKKLYVNYTSNRMFHSFTNVPFKRFCLNYGKNYTVIGYVDLGFLINSFLKEDEDIEKNQINFYAYESCPYATAKSMVLLKMMEEQIESKSILEVWYSSGWTKDTEKDFIRACKLLLQSHTDLNKDLQIILNVWIETSVSLTVSLKLWREQISIISHDCHNLNLEKDRVEVAHYLLTGQIYKNCEVGSRTMFTNPLSSYSKIKDENYIYSQSLEEIPYNPNKSFLESINNFICLKIDETKKNINNKIFNIEFKYKEIIPSDKEIINELAELNSWVIIWTNVCDYFPREDFISLANKISNADTIHFIHSMNWMQEVYGTDIFDFNCNNRKELIDMSKSSTSIISKNYKYLNLMKLLNDEVNTNIQNKVMWYCCSQFKQKWANHFFKGAYCRSIENIVFSNFVRTPTVLYIIFTFNEKLNVNTNYYSKY